MARKITKIGLLTAVLALPACAPAGYISVDAIDGPLNRVCERHDTYTTADTSLTDLQRRTRLKTTELLRKVVEEAKEPVR